METGAPMNPATRRCVFTFFLLCSGAFPLASTGVAFAQPGHGCHAPFTIPGYPRDMAYNAVQVMHRERTTCQTALHPAAKAWTTPGLQIKWGPQFGGGGYGGPFHVGRWDCYLLTPRKRLQERDVQPWSTSDSVLRPSAVLADP